MTLAGPSATRHDHVRSDEHPDCFVCGSAHPAGLQLRFTPRADGSVTAEFDCGGMYQGYGGVIHGGIVAAILDGTMTNCLFALGHAAVTGDLHVRFRHPLCVGRSATIRAWVTRASPPLFVLTAEITQAGRVTAKAVGKFMLKDRRGRPDR